MRSVLCLFLALVLCSSLILLVFTAPSSLGSRRERSGTTKKSRQVKHSHIVQNVDIPGEGLAGRVQCNNASRSEMVTPYCPSSPSATLVSLFIPPPLGSDDHPADNVLVGDKVLLRSERPYAVLRAFTESASMFMPSSQQVLLTAHNARLPAEKLLPGVAVEYLPGNYSRSNLMLQRLQSYVDYLDLQLTRVPGSSTGGYIFTDSDMLIVGDLGCVFSDHPDFDVALTFRNNRKQPINSGMVFVRGTEESVRRGKQLLVEVIETFRRDFTRASRMMGDQLAFAKVVSGISGVDGLFRRGEEFPGDVNGVRVMFLPCLRYNWTPSEGAGQFHGMPLDVRTVHFKGSRKRLMLEAWGRVERRDLRLKHELACFVLRSGRAKYDF